jgi:hypothetical protein
MYSSLLRFTLILLLCSFVAACVAQEGTEDPFGQIIEETKQEKVIEDPFGSPIKDPETVEPKQESENPFGTVQEPAKATTTEPDVGSPFGPAKADPPQEGGSPFGPTKTTEQEMEDPFQNQGTSPFGNTDSAQPETGTTTEADSSNSSILNDNTASDQQLPAEETFEGKFWDYLKSNAYENWAPAPGQSADFYVGESPHGAFLKMYLNRVAMGDPKGLPNGSIIVKENYDVDRATLKAITVMYRSKGYNPNAGDWYWIKYNPDGSVATTSVETGSKKIMGRPDGCIRCHGDADNDDFAFFND